MPVEAIKSTRSFYDPSDGDYNVLSNMVQLSP